MQQLAQQVEVRELAPLVASPRTFSNIFNVREVAGRRVLVNDGLSRQLILLDSSLALSRIVIDSTVSPGVQSYGPGASPLIAYLGDSSLFVDRESRALLLIAPGGTIVRTMASPAQARDFPNLLASASTTDRDGNLIMRAQLPPSTKRVGDPSARIATEETRLPDSTYLLRANFATRVVDTVARLKQTGGMRSLATREPGAQPKPQGFIVSPIETLDDWAMLSDGTIAIVRGGDYHVDFIRSNGLHETTAKLPFDWKSMTDDDKQRIVDSVKRVVDEAPSKAGLPAGSFAALDAQREALVGNVMRLPGAAPEPPRRIVSRPGLRPPQFQYRFVPFDEMPSYFPPLRMGYTKGDADGNLWILPTTSAQSKAGELVYDVVNSKGVMVERVRLPLGRMIAGFGRGGIVYLINKDAAGLWHLERTSVKR